MSDLKVVPLPEPRPDPVVVQRARELLEMAERGEIVSFAMVGVLANGGFLEAWTKRRATLLAGALVSLQWRIARWMNEEP